MTPYKTYQGTLRAVTSHATALAREGLVNSIHITRPAGKEYWVAHCYREHKQ